MRAQCDFCYRHCTIEEGKYGVCLSRKNEGGVIISPSYSELCSIAIDPVEKKPLYHFMPGTKTLSIAEDGCNFFCRFCQNYSISRYHTPHDKVIEEELVSFAKERNIPSISYTYSEPLVWQDYMLSVAKKAKERGLKNIMVTNGSFSDAALDRILPVIDAYNVDLKGSEDFYKKYINGSSIPVRKAIERIVKENKHLEVTTLLIEGIHRKEEILETSKFLESVGVSVLHLTRFFPHYLMNNIKETSEEFLSEVYEEIKEKTKIPYIYRGNTIHIDQTICPNCHKAIKREKNCPYCNTSIYGVF